ncbi:Cysteine-rich protein 2-binding protein [Larimichthys crocea]|uniref:Cysteine-rich protein 2-binding protein n=1 Tax=Larimichthys crocea TaxID=215358 RepID=A0A6G0J856_LARCR|nr:Cysteine-rich protein 2-binding protein [Larimichthys crocea]
MSFYCDRCHKWILQVRRPITAHRDDNLRTCRVLDLQSSGPAEFRTCRVQDLQSSGPAEFRTCRVLDLFWEIKSQLHGEQPSYLKGDNFFKFMCCDCSEDGKESFERMRLTWQQEEDVDVVEHGGRLPVGRQSTFFRSGAQEFGEPGWWKLVQNRPPTLRPEVDKSTTKAKGSEEARARNPVENAMQLKEKRSRTQEAKDIRRAQKEAVGGYADRSASSTPVKLGGGRGGSTGRRPDFVLEKGEVIDFSSLSSSDRTPLTSPSPSPSPDFSAPGTPASHSATPSLLSEADLIPDAMPPQALFHGELTPEPLGSLLNVG